MVALPLRTLVLPKLVAKAQALDMEYLCNVVTCLYVDGELLTSTSAEPSILHDFQVFI